MALLIPNPYGSTASAAYELARKRGLFPTWMGTADIRDLEKGIRERSVFSARTTNAVYLDALKQRIERFLADGYNGDMGKLRLELKDILMRMQYDPVKGFPGDEALGIPAARAGSLQDLSSDKRINLILTTQLQLMAGKGQEQQGLSEAALDLFPAYELVRLESRRVPREWLKDWQTAAENIEWEGVSKSAFADGRMIALKISPIWAAIGSSALFDDALDVSHPPFRFNSGMGWEVRDREAALHWGLDVDGEARAAVPAAVKKLPPETISTNGLSKVTLDRLKSVMADAEAKNGRLTLESIFGNAPSPPARKPRVNAATLCDGLDCLLLLDDAARLNMGTSPGAYKGWETRRKKKQARRGAAALKKALGNQEDKLAAMHVPGLGGIDFLWGARGAKAENEHGATHAGGWGIHHVLDKRGMRAMRRLPVVLAHGKVAKHEEPEKRYIRHAGWTAVVKRSRPGHYSVTTLIDDHIHARRPHG